MRYCHFADQPTSNSQQISNLVGANLVARDRLLRILEIIKLLGFAETQPDFAKRFLNISNSHLKWFLTGRIREFNTNTLDRFQAKLNIGSETTAYELQNACSRIEWLIASTRNDLMQLAQAHFNEFRQKLA